ncbi:PAS domain S-box protein [Lyngbya aestuarii]|uniref:PAS domain S-box protein n=1 Tax=Lyngbya aestuarii TaxID=118322 RepID=UPI00403DFB9D
MTTTSTNNLHLVVLPLVCDLAVGMLIALIAFYICTQLVEQVTSTHERLICFLWLLAGGTLIGIVIWLMQLFAWQGFPVAFPSSAITLLMILSTALILLQNRLATSKLWAQTSNGNNTGTPEKKLTNSKITVSSEISQTQPEQQAARDYELNFRKLTANVPGMIYQFLLRTDGSVSFPFVSEGARDIYELEPSFIQKNAAIIIEAIHPDDREAFQESVVVSAKTLQSWRWQGRIITPSGKLKWLQASAKPELQSSGDILWDGILMDITERKQAEAAWHESEELFKATFEQPGIAIAQVGANGQLLRVNQKLCQITGYSQEELLKKTVLEITCKEDQAATQACLEEFFSGQRQTINLEKRYIHKTGATIWVNITQSVACDPQGVPNYCISVIEDITSRKQAEAQLLKANRDKLNLLESIAEAFFALDEEWCFTYINHKAKQLLARPEEQLLGKCFWEIFPETVGSQFEKQYRRAVAEQVSVKFEEFDQHLNLWFQVRAYPYEGGLSVFFSDVSEWKQAEAALLKRTRLSALATVVEDQLRGVRGFLANGQLTAKSSHTLSWVANAIAVAVDRYWARSEMLSRRESLLFSLATQIRNSLELDTILETAVESIRSLLNIDRCHFIWCKKQSGAISWEVANEARKPTLSSQIGKYTTEEMGAFAQRLLNRQIIQVDEVASYGDVEVQQFLLHMGYTSVLSIPFETYAGEIGVISCYQCTGARVWDDSEVELLQAVVVQLAIAIDQAALYNHARQSAAIAHKKTQELEAALNQLKTTQAQLVQSAKMSSLGQLVAGIAHEINNPVSFIHGNLTYASAYLCEIMGLLHLYQEHCPNPPAVIAEEAELIDINFIAEDLPKLLSSMHVGTERIRTVVLSLQNFSRLDVAEKRQVDVHEGIESTLMVLQHRLKTKSSNLKIEVIREYGNLPPIDCYPGQLNQVLMNILTNAVEAFELSSLGTQQNFSPKISIRTSLVGSSDSTDKSLSLVSSQQLQQPLDTAVPASQKGQKIVIQIADNGPGMTETIKSQIFDPFFSTKPVGQGTGFGLSISYQIIVENHHGVLTCISEPGKGSEFWIEIPLKQSD